MNYFKNISPKTLFIFFLIIWVAINLCQALFTPVIDDETYYYLYGEHLDWGYFDHPPMVGFVVWLSSLFFNGSLGVRFATLFLQIGTLLFVWKIIDDKKPTYQKVCLFFAIAASLPMFVIYGFITTPDGGLLFFTAFFLYAYNRYIKNDNLSHVLMLAVSMAGLLYSKYHAVLLIGLVFLSNWRIIFTKKTIIAISLALILYIPHIVWQISHDFPSFRYHLQYRSSAFQWKYFLEYIPNQLVVFNPVVFFFVIFLMYKHRNISVFERALYFIIIGFFVFFWITSFRGHVEPHWTVLCSIPVLILIYNRVADNAKDRKKLFQYIIPVLAILLIIRVIYPIPEARELIGIHNEKEKMKDIEKVANDIPVLFFGSFQEPSLYTYYTGKQASAVSLTRTRKTQFDLWQFEKELQGKEAFLCLKILKRSEHYSVSGTEFDGFFTKNLQTTNRLKITFDSISNKPIQVGDTLQIKISIYNPYGIDMNFNHSEFPVKLNAFYLEGKKAFITEGVLSPPVSSIAAGSTYTGYVNIPFSVRTFQPEKYRLALGFTSILGSTINSPIFCIQGTK